MVKDEASDKARDKRNLGFNPLACQRPQLIFPNRERALCAGGCFHRYQNHCREVRDPETKAAYPVPPQRSADDDEKFAADRKSDVAEMNGDYDIRERCKARIHSAGRYTVVWAAPTVPGWDQPTTERAAIRALSFRRTRTILP